VGWSQLGTQFCLQLAFGVLLALAFVPKAPVGRLFYRVMGTSAVVPLAVAAVAPVLWGGVAWSDPATIAAGVATLTYPAVSAPVRGWRWWTALAIGLLATGCAIVFSIVRTADLATPLEVALGSFCAMATGAVAGSVALAMVLGHWYLTIPTLHVDHLRRLNRVTIVSIVVDLLLLATSLTVFADQLQATERPLLGPWGLFYLGTRVTVGLLLPLLFAVMTAGSLEFKNTRSATGILYASTILVLIGTAVSISLQDSYGIPL
jgi:hypothetical protein